MGAGTVIKNYLFIFRGAFQLKKSKVDLAEPTL